MFPEQRGLEVIGNKSKFISEHVFIFVVFGYVANLLVAKETRQKVFFRNRKSYRSNSFCTLRKGISCSRRLITNHIASQWSSTYNQSRILVP